MQYNLLVSLLVSGALAAPMVVENSPAVSNQVARRQLGGGGITQNDVEQGKCSDITLIFARGSTEPGNMGISVGPPTCSGLKRKFNSVSCQGVGGAYSAGLTTNALPRGTTPSAIKEGVDLFAKAASDCPNTIMVGGGYSQGAAVMTGSVEDSDESVKSRIAGAVLYGNTQNAQNHGKIPDYPDENALTICAASDGVCGGALLVTAGHLTYSDDVGKAVDFLAERIQALQSSGGASASTGSSTDSGSSSSGAGSLFGGGGSSLFGGLGGSSSDTASTESTDSTASTGSSLSSLFGKK